MSYNLTHLIAKLLEMGMRPQWLRGLTAAPADYTGSGLRANQLLQLKQHGAIRLVRTRQVNRAQVWTTGPLHESFLVAIERLEAKREPSPKLPATKTGSGRCKKARLSDVLAFYQPPRSSQSDQGGIKNQE